MTNAELTGDKKEESRMAYITYNSSRMGYVVTVWSDDDGSEIETYYAGNSPYESTIVVDPDVEDAIAPEKLAAWARATALDMAEEYDVDRQRVQYDPAW